MSIQTAKAVKCFDEAHSNVYIDNCMVCLGHSWGEYYACPTCTSEDGTKAIKLSLSATGKSGLCRVCKKRYNTDFYL